MGKTLLFFIFILLKVYPWTLMPPSIGWSVGLSQFHKAVKLKLSFYTPIRALFVLLQQISRSDKLNTVSLIKKNVTHPWPPKFAPSGRAIISASWYDQIAGMTNKIPVFFMPFLCLNLAKIAKTIERFVFHKKPARLFSALFAAATQSSTNVRLFFARTEDIPKAVTNGQRNGRTAWGNNLNWSFASKSWQLCLYKYLHIILKY